MLHNLNQLLKFKTNDAFDAHWTAFAPPLAEALGLTMALMARAAAAAARRVARAGSCGCVDDVILVEDALAATLAFDASPPAAAALRAAAFASAKAARRSFKFAINLRCCSFSSARVGRGLEGS